MEMFIITPLVVIIAITVIAGGEHHKFGRLTIAVCAALFIAVFTSKFFINYAPINSDIITLEGTKVQRHLFLVVKSDSRKIVETFKLGNSSFQATNLPSVTFLTENPKVRTIKHNLVVTLADPYIFYSADSTRMDIRNAHISTVGKNEELKDYISKLVASQVYEFNNSNSRALAPFYNPFSIEQQMLYTKLLDERVAPALAKDGIAIKSASFEIH